MSALLPIADIQWKSWHVRFVPIADIGGSRRSVPTGCSNCTCTHSATSENRGGSQCQKGTAQTLEIDKLKRSRRRHKQSASRIHLGHWFNGAAALSSKLPLSRQIGRHQCQSQTRPTSCKSAWGSSRRRRCSLPWSLDSSPSSPSSR